MAVGLLILMLSQKTCRRRFLFPFRIHFVCFFFFQEPSSIAYPIVSIKDVDAQGEAPAEDTSHPPLQLPSDNVSQMLTVPSRTGSSR